MNIALLGEDSVLYALILAGGKGTRLYPLSRSENPKQFLKVINNKSFLRATVDRIKPLVNNDNIYIVTNEEYMDKIYEELPEIKKENIFAEPYNRETATCIGFSAVKLLKKDKDASMIVLPSDHYIENEKEFTDVIKQGVDIVEKKRGLVTIGIKPLRPETGYGYIKMGDKVNSQSFTYKVERFLEKPNLEIARDLVSSEEYLWNSGMFIWRADVYLREMEKYLPKIYKSMIRIYANIDTDQEEKVIREEYEVIEGISVDFGIMQKTRKAYVIESNFKWDDMGSFTALSRFLNSCRDNSICSNSYLKESENCSVIAKDKLVIGFGIKDLVIVDGGDVLLIMDKYKDQEIKHLVQELKANESLKKYI
ncbi:mannose-1-phosphate guanylyltransferase (GDP) [Clostridium botulinum H04402 065]|nr:mannose-1-phosphate guanylyltransferase [Clostridium botulinum]CBZ01923.1 mannose-1-phosphate guanylyltransferase (GDP) [Clostridium botulinum H04402 065]